MNVDAPRVGSLGMTRPASQRRHRGPAGSLGRRVGRTAPQMWINHPGEVGPWWIFQTSGPYST